jgi:hypothetical protein
MVALTLMDHYLRDRAQNHEVDRSRGSGTGSVSGSKPGTGLGTSNPVVK